MKQLSRQEKIEELDLLLVSRGWEIFVSHLQDKIKTMYEEIENRLNDNNYPVKKTLGEIKLIKDLINLPQNLIKEFEFIEDKLAQMNNVKLSRDDAAEIMMEAALKIKGNNIQNQLNLIEQPQE